MVKGNWERRAELASMRRAEEKERKALKKTGGKAVNPESILQKLYKDSFLKENGARIDVYVADPEGDMMCCGAHLRTADCRMKRCRLMHDDSVSIAHLRHLPPIGGIPCGKEDVGGCRPPPVPLAVVDSSSSSMPEKRCLPPCTIDEIMPLKDWSALMFVAVDGECIYDYLTPEVWNNWSTKHRALVAEARTSSRAGLSTVHEGTGGDDDDNDDSDEGNEEEGENAIATSSSSSAAHVTTTPLITLCNGKGGLVEKCSPALAVLLSYLSVSDVVCSVSLACKSLKTCVLRDESFRIRRCFSFIVTLDHPSHNSFSITHSQLTLSQHYHHNFFRREALALVSHDLR